MKILHTLGWYFPESIGGTEVYVAGLCRELQRNGTEVAIAAARDAHVATQELISGVPVFRYPVPTERTHAQITGAEPHREFEQFRAWLAQQQVDIYHQHSLTYGCNTHHLMAAKTAGLRTVLTIHTPDILCLRGTLMRQGTTVCDGNIIVSRCAACWLQSRGAPEMLTSLLSVLPPALGKATRAWGRLGTAVAATQIASEHRSALQRAVEYADKVVAVCQWLYDALLLNGVPREKLVLSRQGVAQAPTINQRATESNAPLVIGFLGRGDPVKGVGVLVAALGQLPRETPVLLRLHVVESNEATARDYMQQAKKLAADDPRIEFLPALSPAAVPDFLAKIDVLAVPSQWLETGPLVVLEALAAGVPVLGSELGGIAELIQHRQNGLLVRHDDVAAWAAAVQELCADTDLLPGLRAGIGPVRTMAHVARDMHTLYSELITKH